MKFGFKKEKPKNSEVKTVWAARVALSVGILAAYTLLTQLNRNKGIGKELSTSKDSQPSRKSLGWMMEEVFFVAISRLKIPFSYWDERYVSRLLKNIKGRVFVDVGANRGYYCVLLAENFPVMYAVEPARDNIQTMKRLFRRGSIRPVIIEAAVTDHDGSATLVKGRDHARHHLRDFPKSGDSYRTSYTVPSVSIDSLVEKFGAIDLLKVDVEGAEWLVLKGADRQTSKISRWLVEMHTLDRKGELESWMRNHQYDYAWIDKGHLYAWKTPVPPSA